MEEYKYALVRAVGDMTVFGLGLGRRRWPGDKPRRRTGGTLGSGSRAQRSDPDLRSKEGVRQVHGCAKTST